MRARPSPPRREPSRKLLTPKAEDVRLDLMPDRLHPNAAGHRKWAHCLERKLSEMSQL